jgi:BMFP domain-containing protein YqiC
MGNGLRTEMRTEFAKIRQEMAELRTDLTTEIAGLRGDMHRAMHSQTNKMLTLMVAMITLVLISSGFVTRLSG